MTLLLHGAELVLSFRFWEHGASKKITALQVGRFRLHVLDPHVLDCHQYKPGLCEQHLFLYDVNRTGLSALFSPHHMVHSRFVAKSDQRLNIPDCRKMSEKKLPWTEIAKGRRNLGAATQGPGAAQD